MLKPLKMAYEVWVLCTGHIPGAETGNWMKAFGGMAFIPHQSSALCLACRASQVPPGFGDVGGRRHGSGNTARQSALFFLGLLPFTPKQMPAVPPQAPASARQPTELLSHTPNAEDKGFNRLTI
ncbi:hypothetical protein AAFF_G00039080 [Aldrovandia affinis]|uniref:Uncharacterized protein n=1 Tax=Aldrovandia affinis TaxID=143900 RepID=A0AAD7T5E6_9TELE|nr:hypothetical protein AAFF_G00039080 [Aldrovandia affinis]